MQKELLLKQKQQKERGYVNSWMRNIKRELYLVAKQMKRENRDIVGGGCVKDENGKIVKDGSLEKIL